MAGLTVAIAELRTRITFQSPTVTQGTDGAQTTAWANVASVPTVWARWINEHGNEAIANESLKSVQRARVTVRYRTDIVTTWRVVNGSEYWQVISIDHVRGENRWTELVVERAKGTL